MTPERNIATFNADVTSTGQYLYTNKQQLSSRLATYRQSLEIIRLIKTYVTPHPRILDVGSGDGTYTFELYRTVSPRLIVGFDPADRAVRVAQKKVPSHLKSIITFETLSIYDVAKRFSASDFDVVVIRGVLHHLDNAAKAIGEISKIAKQVIVLEPNGYNIILKGIEKFSPYHKRHDEKSYWPPELNQWFKNNGYHLIDQRFVCIVPYFCPPWMAITLEHLQPFFERIPFIRRFYTGTNVFLMRTDAL